MNYNHPDPKVNRALMDLDAALCEHERLAGAASAVIVRDERGFEHRSLSGKPNVPKDISDEDLLIQVSPT